MVKKKETDGALTEDEEKALKAGGFDISPQTERGKELMGRCEEEDRKNYKRKNYKVWEVSYNYDCSFEHPEERVTDTYYILAETIGKAETKANELFFKNEYGKDLFDRGEVRRSIREYIVDVPFPELSLERDIEDFFIEARLSGDGQFPNRIIEFVPRPYLVKPRRK